LNGTLNPTQNSSKLRIDPSHDQCSRYRFNLEKETEGEKKKEVMDIGEPNKVKSSMYADVNMLQDYT
jgi:hypothetical protein